MKRYWVFKKMIDKIRLDAGCADCGYNENPVALDFDHLPQYKKFLQVTQMATYSNERIMAEIAKCEVVCANCHRIRTHKRKQENVE
jgi:hypothetical protein